MERAAVLRVKRKRGEAVPAEALVLACKRLRTEEDTATTPAEDEVEKNLFKLVATVASEDEPVEKYVQDAITKNKAVQLLRPSLGSAQRIIQDLRSSKHANRQESRYRLIASHRPNFADGKRAVLAANGEELNKNNQLVSEAKKDTSLKENHGISDCCGEFQLFDIVQEEDEEKDPGMSAAHLQKPDAILCNAVEMIRQNLTISDSSKKTEHNSKAEEYVYDIYYMETASPHWIENILSVQPYTQDCELVSKCQIRDRRWMKIASQKKCMRMRMMRTMRIIGGMTTQMKMNFSVRRMKNQSVGASVMKTVDISGEHGRNISLMSYGSLDTMDCRSWILSRTLEPRYLEGFFYDM
ncbi:probable RNA polymerase II nuclear localization protein SLC7A6OS isoform X2 [Rhineura floridana]|uniref:probable RNA polymerase II nuclear localization protein SLC7A6OS isoform X2 n=1 Tax=Rhineura floridana TaxID=261503 RepID=UPI002AC7EB43|nr:probable RNA polymerase II nuclear localization protein SLC7A6OS isoform X2 [Rhineura floridana]